MIDITWLLLIVPVSMALGGVCGIGALALVIAGREADAEIGRR
ncbi:hypothetical protein SEA_PHONEGINGI_2 [Microbacterium phage Phonegingi]|nr:hypothetical protein SEA_PHONEGINGI_2 [Microbacterium phage Phonegingi]